MQKADPTAMENKIICTKMENYRNIGNEEKDDNGGRVCRIIWLKREW